MLSSIHMSLHDTRLVTAGKATPHGLCCSVLKFLSISGNQGHMCVDCEAIATARSGLDSSTSSTYCRLGSRVGGLPLDPLKLCCEAWTPNQLTSVILGAAVASPAVLIHSQAGRGNRAGTVKFFPDRCLELLEANRKCWGSIAGSVGYSNRYH